MQDSTLTPAFIPTQDTPTEYLPIGINGSTDLFRIGASTHGVYMHLVFRRQFTEEVVQAWPIQTYEMGTRGILECG